MVINGKIANEYVRKRFFNIPTITYRLAKRQHTFIGKVVRNLEDQIPTQLLTAWSDNKRKTGDPLQNNKKNLAQKIRLIVPGSAKDGLITTWVYLSLDDVYWAHLVKQLGAPPSTWNGAEPNPRSMPPPRSSRRTASCQQLPVDKPLKTHLLLSVLAILTSLQRCQDATRHNHLQDAKRHRDAKSRPDGLRAITIITIQKS